jgi:hypothetical protein
MSQAPASRPGNEGKVEGSQLQLYKAKEGSRKHKAIRMPKYPRFANLALIGNSAARASAEI